MRKRLAAHGKQVEHALLGFQLLALTFAALIFALLPPEDGPVLAVSLRPHSAAGLLGTHTQLLGTGLLPGSLVITGDRPSFWAALVDQSVLILPAVPALCGGAETVESAS